jgi:predicted nucleotidyltransferase
VSLNEIITGFPLINQSRQLDLLAFVAKVLKASSSVSHLLIRGSIAAGRSDRLSDVDLVIGVRDTLVCHFLTALDTLVKTELGSLFPGWRDSLAPNMGGVGFVYLVPFEGELYELDLYVVSESTAPSITNYGATVIFSRTHACIDQGLSEIDKEELLIPPPPESDVKFDLVAEILVLLHMISKRVMRMQSFIIYGDMYLLNDAVRRLIKSCLAPQSQHWGWYYLEEEIAANSQGDICLRELAALVKAPLVYDRSDLQQVFTHIERVIICAAPEVWSELKWELDAYRHYMEFL